MADVGKDASEVRCTQPVSVVDDSHAHNGWVERKLRLLLRTAAALVATARWLLSFHQLLVHCTVERDVQQPLARQLPQCVDAQQVRVGEVQVNEAGETEQRLGQLSLQHASSCEVRLSRHQYQGAETSEVAQRIHADGVLTARPAIAEDEEVDVAEARQHLRHKCRSVTYW